MDTSKYPKRRNGGGEPAEEILQLGAAQVVNLSLTGAAVETTSRPSFDRRYRLCFARESSRLEVSARVARCVLRRSASGPGGVGGVGGPVYEVGFVFEDVLSREARKVLRFLDANSELGPGHRIGDRLPLHSGTRVDRIDEVSGDGPPATFRGRRGGPG